jgi:hypothetical protein
LTETDVTVEALNLDATQLQREVLRVRRRVQKLLALLRVLLVVLRMSGYSLSQARLPEGDAKTLATARRRTITCFPAATIRAARRAIVAFALPCLER